MRALYETHPYIVELEYDKGEESKVGDYCDWCEQTFGDRWKLEESADIMADLKIRFRTEADRNWFIMRWS